MDWSMMLRVLGLDPIMGHCLVIPHANCAMQKWKILNTLFPCVQACHADLLALATPPVRQSLPNPAVHPSEFCDVILGTCWIDGLDTQKFCDVILGTCWIDGLDTQKFCIEFICSQGRKSHLTS